jgi:hypothetical protein
MEAIVRQGRECDPRTLLAQIGAMNFLAISGGRFEVIYALDSEDDYGPYPIGVRLPVAQSRSVEVTLDWSDTYRVRRVRKVTQGAQRGSEVIEAEQTDVYFDEVGEVAYSLSCWK